MLKPVPHAGQVQKALIDGINLDTRAELALLVPPAMRLGSLQTVQRLCQAVESMFGLGALSSTDRAWSKCRSAFKGETPLGCRRPRNRHQSKSEMDRYARIPCFCGSPKAGVHLYVVGNDLWGTVIRLLCAARLGCCQIRHPDARRGPLDWPEDTGVQDSCSVGQRLVGALVHTLGPYSFPLD